MDESVLNKDVHEIRRTSLWQNKKNEHIYSVIGTGKHSETFEEMVLYEAPDGTLWVRPLDLFKEKFRWMHD